MTSIDDLPVPTPSEEERSQLLSHCIAQEMDMQNAVLSFSHFMSLALYHPMFGYYMQPGFNIGKSGDFITAPHLSSLFASCLAQQCRDYFTHYGHDTLLELGAGTGQLAGDLLAALETIHCLPTHYYIYEISPILRERQKQHISLHCPHLLSRVVWLGHLPEHFSGIIIANEVLDALPIHRFTILNQRPVELGVTRRSQTFDWHPFTQHSALLDHAQHYLDRYAFPDDYTSEIHLHLIDFIKSLSNLLKEGVILFIDYGYGEREYYHPERRQGTLTCFYRHRHHDNPFIYPGLQDITAHVNFTQVIDTAFDEGCELGGFTTQSAFLLACGLLEHAEQQAKALTPAASFQLQQDIKTLIMPNQMGDRVKVMALNKNSYLQARGFSLTDRRRDL